MNYMKIKYIIKEQYYTIFETLGIDKLLKSFSIKFV